jgi:hypothetical protein
MILCHYSSFVHGFNYVRRFLLMQRHQDGRHPPQGELGVAMIVALIIFVLTSCDIVRIIIIV